MSMAVAKDVMKILENKSLKVLEDMLPDSHDSSDKLKSDFSPDKRMERPRLPTNDLRILTKNRSNKIYGASGPGTPLINKSRESESLIEDSFFLDFKESAGTPPAYQQSSHKSDEDGVRRGLIAVAPLPDDP